MQTDPIGYEDNVNLYAYVGGDPINGVDPSGTTCTQTGDNNGVPVYTCKVDAVMEGSGKNRTIRPTNEADDKRLASFNQAYTNAVNNLVSNAARTAQVPDLKGNKGGFKISADEAAQNLISRVFIDAPSEVKEGLVADALWNDKTGRSEGQILADGRASVLLGNNANTQIGEVGIVHDGGIHGSEAEASGGLQGAPLRRTRHQDPYNRAACRLLGVSGACVP